MIQYNPHPILLQIGSTNVFAWGTMLAIGITIAALLLYKVAKEKEISQGDALESLIYVILASIMGARLMHYIVYRNEYKSLLEIFQVWNGGMISYGGFLFGILALTAYAKIKKIRLGTLFDCYAPGFAIGITITLIGCFLNWDDYGIQSSLPWAVQASGDIARHPTQIYQFIILIAAFLFMWSIRNHKELIISMPTISMQSSNKKTRKIKMMPGNLFLLFLMIYSAQRALIDSIREYEPGIRQASQISMALLFIISLAIFINNIKKNDEKKAKKERK